MLRLNYETLKKMENKEFILKSAPERILQFGEGNFLRGFVDYFIDILNEKEAFNSKIVVVQPIAQGLTEEINIQEGIYTLYLRGLKEGKKVTQKRIISSISRAINPYTDFAEFIKNAQNPELRFIVSNTTEAGIVFTGEDGPEDEPPASFPGKLTRFLMERYKYYGQEKGRGFIILSCELIDNNGIELKRCVEEYARLWNLSEDFIKWIHEENTFCNTLVDRIITGYPKIEAEKLNDENGYIDRLIDTGEVFAFWAIEGPDFIREELPLTKAGLPVVIVPDQTPYKKRKVRILNGAQTGISLAAYLAGHNIGRGYMDDPIAVSFINQIIFDEIIPSLDLPKDDMISFANDAIQRLKNPFIDHQLLAISLNTVAKWKARVLPSFKDYYFKKGTLPKCIVFSLASLLAFYTGSEIRDGVLIGHRGKEEYFIMDDRAALEFFAENSKTLPVDEYVKAYLSDIRFNGEDLTVYKGFVDEVTRWLEEIRSKGMKMALENVVKL